MLSQGSGGNRIMPKADLLKSLIKTTVALPEDLHDEYAEQAIDENMTVEEIISQRLSRCHDHKGRRPLWLNDEQLREIESILGGRRYESPKQLINDLRYRYTITLQGKPIHIPEDLYHAIRIRAEEIHADAATVIREQALWGIRYWVWGDTQ